MSASPANQPAPVMRKKPAASIFNPKKKPIRKPLQAQTYTASGQVPVSGQTGSGPAPKAQPATNGHGAAPAHDDDPSLYQEYPIFIHKNALLRGLHHHAFKFHQTGQGPDNKPIEVSPYSEQQFTRPVRLHRRLARDKPEGDLSDAASGIDDKEREQREAKKVERQAEREANQAQIAPTGEAAVKKQMKKKQQKKVEDVYYNENNPKQKARSQLRYEEARPWHLEDFDGKQKWVGSYQEPLSGVNVMFEVTEGGFKMIPVEKWYKMIRADRVSAMNMDQVEKIMAQKHFAPRWFLGSHEAADDARKAAYAAKREEMEAVRQQKKKNKMEDDDPFVKQEEYRADVDEIDFEFNDEFQDDDEGFIFGDQGDDDVKDIERRIREEMRSANLAGTGVKDEDKDYDSEEKKEKLAKDEERKKQKKLRRKLKKKELRHEYESDTDDENKYEESSDSEDSEEEREREEEERKKREAEEEEARTAAQTNGSNSGASTKGTNTPTGRSEKRPIAGASLKRDAELSELSGNESSRRKKAKLNGGSGLSSAARALARKSNNISYRVLAPKANHPQPMHPSGYPPATARAATPIPPASAATSSSSRTVRPVHRTRRVLLPTSHALARPPAAARKARRLSLSHHLKKSRLPFPLRVLLSATS